MKVLALPKIINGAAVRNNGVIAQTAATNEGNIDDLFHFSRARCVCRLKFYSPLTELFLPAFLSNLLWLSSTIMTANNIILFAFAYLFLQIYIRFNLLLSNYIHVFNSHLTRFVIITVSFIGLYNAI